MTLKETKELAAVISADIREAVKEGRQAARNIRVTDGGSCNFDSPIICFKEKSKKLLKYVSMPSDCRASLSHSWKYSYFVGFDPGGQADIRTQRAEAIASVLSDRLSKHAEHLLVTVYYMMD